MTEMTFGIVRIRSAPGSSSTGTASARSTRRSLRSRRSGPGRIASMATLFTRIIDGELPGRFVWRDDRAVCFLTINPITTGHALVVPIEEVDHWVDVEPDLAAHLMVVAHAVGRAQMQAF